MCSTSSYVVRSVGRDWVLPLSRMFDLGPCRSCWEISKSVWVRSQLHHWEMSTSLILMNSSLFIAWPVNEMRSWATCSITVSVRTALNVVRQLILMVQIPVAFLIYRLRHRVMECLLHQLVLDTNDYHCTNFTGLRTAPVFPLPCMSSLMDTTSTSQSRSTSSAKVSLTRPPWRVSVVVIFSAFPT